MGKFFKSRLIRSIVPYFVLGVLLIVFFRLIEGVGFFVGHLRQFWRVLTPFFIGAIIAYILNLPCSAIQRLYRKINNRFVQRRSRALSVLTLFIIIVVLVVLAVNIVVPTVTGSINTFIKETETHEQTFNLWMETLDYWNLPDFIPANQQDIFNMVQEFFGEGGIAATVAAGLVAGLGVTAQVVFTTILAIITSIYLLIEKDRFKGFVKRAGAAVFVPKTNDTILKYSRKLNHNFHMYIYTQTIAGIILGSLMTGLLLVFQSPHALFLGITLGIVNYIPFFGSIFGTIFAVIVVAFTQGIPTAALAAIFMFTLQQIDGNFIQPRLMGGSFSLNPLLVIFSITIAMAYWGVLGMLVAVPIVAIFKDTLDEYIEERERKKRESRSKDEESIMDTGVGQSKEKAQPS